MEKTIETIKDLREAIADEPDDRRVDVWHQNTGRVMIAYEKVCLAARPDWIIVVGDVKPTAACAMTKPFQQGRDIARACHLGILLGRKHHGGKARVGPQHAHPLSKRGDIASLIHGAQIGQQLFGDGKRAFRRCIRKDKFAGRRSPSHAIQQQAG